MECVRRWWYEDTVRRSLTEMEYRVVYSVIYNSMILEALRHLDTALRQFKPFSFQKFSNSVYAPFFHLELIRFAK